MSRLLRVADVAHALTEAVARDAASVRPGVADAVKLVRDHLNSPAVDLSLSLVTLTTALLVDVPFRLTRQAMQALLFSCIRWASTGLRQLTCRQSLQQLQNYGQVG